MYMHRYLSVAKNKRLRVFIVPREHLDEVGGYHSWERWLVTMCLLMVALTIVSQQNTQMVDHSVVL